VQEFLKVDNLDIDEVDLVRALVKWGENQVKKDPSPFVWLRDKILPALPLIRFVGMSSKDLMQVCVGELKAVLTAAEKLQIMQRILLKDLKMLPLNLTTSLARSKKIKIPEIPLRQLHVVTLPYAERTASGNYKKNPFTCVMEFKVGQSAKLVGLNLAEATVESSRFKSFFFTVFKKTPGRILACGDSETILNHSTGKCLKVSPEICLQPGCNISIQFTFPKLSSQSTLLQSSHFALQALTLTDGWPKVSLTGNMDVLLPITSLVFDV
jgi:hypothetical protein